MRGEIKMAEIIINSEEDFNNIIKEGVCLIDFYATWCGPCKMLAPFIEEVADAFEGKVNVCKVDVDEVESLAYKYNVRSIPTLLYFKDGKLVETTVGFQDKASIERKLNEYLD